MAALLKVMSQVREDDAVLDIGCGPGVMTPWFGRMLGPNGRYIGFDIHHASVQWCRTRFKTDDRFHFEIADAITRFPLADGAAGFILAKSVFTHLTKPEARTCLGEIRRVLAPGRTALVTAFLFDGVERGAPAAIYFPFSDNEGSVRWRWRMRPRSAIAFDRSFFENMVEEAGLRIALFRPGFFPGEELPRGQDIIFLANRDEATPR